MADPVLLAIPPLSLRLLRRGVLWLALLLAAFLYGVTHLPSKQECLNTARPWNMRVAALFPQAALSDQALNARCEWLSD